MLIRWAALLCLLRTAAASEIVDVPGWVLRGIAAVETHSQWDPVTMTGRYVDQIDGRDGEVGMFQIRRAALRQVRQLAMRAQCRRDPVCAEFCTILYLRWLYVRFGSWRLAVGLYNVGPDGDRDAAADYCRRVRLAAGLSP